MSSIREVAKLANVSISAVSRVINNDKNFKISEETKQKIYSAIKELNYIVPDSYKKNRVKKDSIGCIQRITPEGKKDDYFSTISTGIKEYLSEHGKTLQFLYTQFDFNSSEYETIFNTYPKGMILMGEISSEAYEFLKSKVQYIVGIDCDYPDIDTIKYNRYNAGIDAVEYLIECGHKKIAYIGSNIIKDKLHNIGRFEAYQKVMAKNNLQIYDDWVIDCKWQKDLCFQKTIELLTSSNPPTAIFVASDHMAIAAISAINTLNLNVPDDVSVIGISNIGDSAYMTPPLTTVSIPQKEMGKIAADILFQRMNGDTTITKQVYVPASLIIRDSVKKI